jgi:hypothetical protein
MQLYYNLLFGINSSRSSQDADKSPFICTLLTIPTLADARRSESPVSVASSGGHSVASIATRVSSQAIAMPQRLATAGNGRDDEDTLGPMLSPHTHAYSSSGLYSSSLQSRLQQQQQQQQQQSNSYSGSFTGGSYTPGSYSEYTRNRLHTGSAAIAANSGAGNGSNGNGGNGGVSLLSRSNEGRQRLTDDNNSHCSGDSSSAVGHDMLLSSSSGWGRNRGISTTGSGFSSSNDDQLHSSSAHLMLNRHSIRDNNTVNSNNNGISNSSNVITDSIMNTTATGNSCSIAQQQQQLQQLQLQNSNSVCASPALSQRSQPSLVSTPGSQRSVGDSPPRSSRHDLNTLTTRSGASAATAGNASNRSSGAVVAVAATPPTDWMVLNNKTVGHKPEDVQQRIPTTELFRRNTYIWQTGPVSTSSTVLKGGIGSQSVHNFQQLQLQAQRMRLPATVSSRRSSGVAKRNSMMVQQQLQQHQQQYQNQQQAQFAGSVGDAGSTEDFSRRRKLINPFKKQVSTIENVN